MEDDSGARPDERRLALGAAIRFVRAGRTQAELGELLGVPQTTVSRWEAGMVDLGYDQIASIESALRIPLGTLALTAGYFDPVLLHADTTVVRDVAFGALDEALKAAEGAARLDFGVRLFNRWVPVPGAEAEHFEEWVVVLIGDAPHAQ